MRASARARQQPEFSILRCPPTPDLVNQREWLGHTVNIEAPISQRDISRATELTQYNRSEPGCHDMKLSLLLAIAALARAADFDTAVKPVLTNNCVICHNDKSAPGGLNASAFLDPATLETRRDGWERILSRVRSGQMPPKNAPKLAPAQVDTFIAFIQAELDRTDSKSDKK
ncbi:MAG TPA: hypothetical protein VKB79_22775 [Bryobacteraceae bacterium]|nr:hypothetical protein [Bryobacteraceae bacterium]